MKILSDPSEKESKAIFDAVLNGTKVSTIVIETDKKRIVNLCIGGEAVERIRAKASRALEAGNTVTWEDGRMQWIEISPLYGSTESGGLFWHKDGNKIRCEKCLHTKGKDGKMTREVVKSMWVSYDKAMEIEG